MNVQQLEIYCGTQPLSQFCESGRGCQVSQPTLSAMLVKLEEELDTRIFERSNKSVSPTASGKKIIHRQKRHCRR